MPLVTKTFSEIITFTRASSGTYFDATGTLQTATTDAARFDYDPSTLAARGFLVEEQRTNLMTYSAAFDNAAWTKNNATVTANATTAPDGGANADKLVENAGAGAKQIYQTGLSFVSGTAYTLSVFAKQSERGFIYVGTAVGVFSAAPSCSVNLSSGAIVQSPSGNSSTLTVTNAGNGWFRIQFTATATSTTTSAGFDVRPSVNGTDAGSYTGDGASGIFLWGAQLEAGAFPTSYIATTTASATRSADVASVNTLSPWYNASEGTIYAESTIVNSLPTNATAFCISGGTFNSFNDYAISVRHRGSTESNARGAVQNVTSQADISVSAATETRKYALGYKENDFAFTANGAAVTTDTSGTVPAGSNVNQALIGGAPFTGAGHFCGYIRRITYYPRKLSSAELQGITT